jgi:hypothetical protein
MSSESRYCTCGAAIVRLVSSRLAYPSGFKQVRFSDRCLLCARMHAVQDHTSKESESEEDEEEDEEGEEGVIEEDENRRPGILRARWGGADHYHRTLPYIPPSPVPHTCRALRRHGAIADISRISEADFTSELLAALPISLAYVWCVFQAVLEMASKNPLSTMIFLTYAIWILR